MVEVIYILLSMYFIPYNSMAGFFLIYFMNNSIANVIYAKGLAHCHTVTE